MLNVWWYLYSFLHYTSVLFKSNTKYNSFNCVCVYTYGGAYLYTVVGG